MQKIIGVEALKSICIEFISNCFILKDVSKNNKYLSKRCLLSDEETGIAIENSDVILEYLFNEKKFNGYQVLNVKAFKIDDYCGVVSIELYLRNLYKIPINLTCKTENGEIEIVKIYIEKLQEISADKQEDIINNELYDIFEINEKVDIERENLINSIDGGYCSFKIDGSKITPLSFSYKLPAFFGYTNNEFSEIFYSRILDIFPKNKRKYINEEVHKASSLDRPYSTTLEIINKKGDINAIYLTFKTVNDYKGNKILNVLILGKNYEVKLHKDVLNYMSLGIVVIQDKSNEIIFINNTAKHVLDKNPDLKSFIVNNEELIDNYNFDNEIKEMVFEKKVASGLYYEIKEKIVEWLGGYVRIKIITDLTANRRILKSMSENTKRLDLSIRSLNAICWTYIVEKDSLIVDNHFKKSFELKSNLIVNFDSVMKKTSFIHPQDRNIFFNEINKIIVGSPNRIFCVRMRLKKDGPYKWCKLINNLINEKDEPIKILITIQNISEDMVSMKKFINLSEQFEYEASVNLASFIINLTHNSIEKIISSRGDINYSQFKNAKQLYDYSKECRIGNYNKKNDDTYMNVDYLLNCYREGKTSYNYLVSYLFNGKRLWVKKSFSLLKNPINNDILAFHNIKDATDDIHVNQILDYVVNNHFDFIVRINLNSKQCNMVTNPKYAPQKGKNRYTYNLNELISFMFDRGNLRIPSEEEYLNTLRANLINRNLYENYIEYEENGKNVRKKYNLYKLDDIDESIIIACSDITALTHSDKKKADALTNALDLANQANKAKSTFLSAMSHDIRTPINAIIGMTNIALSDLKDEKQIAQSFRVIKDSSLHLLSLINEILEMSAIESGKHKIKNEPLNFDNLIIKLMERIKPIAEKKDINLVLKNRVNNPCFLGDALSINRIIENIVNNAIKFTPNNGFVFIDITDHKIDVFDNNVLTISVKDSGQGIDEENLSKIFESFYRTGNAAKGGIEGTGLGLSITKGLVDSIGGKITVESKLKVGTTFNVELPIIRFEKKIIESENLQQQKYSSNVLENLKVLLVEDHPINALVAKKMLVNVGAKVINAKDGQEGIDLFKRSSINYYDIIFMDIQMPKVDGYEAVKIIRDLDRDDAKSIPIIAMTANAFVEDVRKCLSCGMNSHIAKPIEMNKLISEVRKFTVNKNIS
jgi:signal transduction histidine kinase/CheY-like chemotaxis protein